MDYGKQNTRAALNQEAIIEKLGYGVLDTSTEFHNKRVVRQTFFGRERKKYGKGNYDQCLADILKRIKKSMDSKETTQLKFQVDMRDGKPHTAIWLSEYTVTYDNHNLDKTS